MDEWSLQIIEQVKSSDKLAYNLINAACVLDISYSSLRREIKRGKIFKTPQLNLITREELCRYLREETQLARKRPRHLRANSEPTKANRSSKVQCYTFRVSDWSADWMETMRKLAFFIIKEP